MKYSIPMKLHLYILINYNNYMEKSYTVLGINSNATKEDIKKAYINLMLKYHPDRVGNKFLEKCKEINKAYKTIMEEKYGENPNIPKEFSNLGFTKVPTLHEYVTKFMSSSLK